MLHVYRYKLKWVTIADSQHTISTPIPVPSQQRSRWKCYPKNISKQLLPVTNIERVEELPAIKLQVQMPLPNEWLNIDGLNITSESQHDHVGPSQQEWPFTAFGGSTQNVHAQICTHAPHISVVICLYYWLIGFNPSNKRASWYQCLCHLQASAILINIGSIVHTANQLLQFLYTDP